VRHEGDGLEFLDFEDAQIRPPAMKPEQWVMIGTEALGKRLTAPSLVEHAADADAVDVCGFDTESDDTTRKHVHHDHHPAMVTYPIRGRPRSQPWRDRPPVQRTREQLS
jgi:hypothetical protein